MESVSRTLARGRLALEVSRSFRKWAQLPPLAGNELAQWTSEWMNGSHSSAETAEELTDFETTDPELQDDPELHDESAADLGGTRSCARRRRKSPHA